MNRTTAFNTFIDFLNSAKIRYLILGDTSRYPEEIGSDVDIMIDKKSFLQMKKTILSFCQKYNFSLIQKIQHESNASFFVITYANKNENIYLQLDCYYSYTNKGRNFLKGSVLLDNAILSPNGIFNILAPSYAFLYYFIKKVDKGRINSSQFSYLKTVYESDKTGINKALKKIFKESTVSTIEDIFNGNDYTSLQSELRIIKEELFTVKKKSIKGTIGFLLTKLKRIFQPTGLIIGVLGRDGTGKSTLINHLEAEMSLAFRRIEYFHLYPGLILNNNKKEDFSTPHQKKKRSASVSFLKLIVFYFEYTLGFWCKLYPQKIQSTLIIMDRYFVDMYADPDRYRSSSSKQLIWLIHKLIPKPDLWLILDASTEAVFKRKQEVEFSVSETQRKNYLELGKKLKGAHVLDTERDIKDELLAAAEIINKKLASKFL